MKRTKPHLTARGNLSIGKGIVYESVFYSLFRACGEENFFIERCVCMEKRIGVVGIVLDCPETSVKDVNGVLSEFAELILGRMGLPYKKRAVSVISLIVEGTTDEIGAMTGKLGQIKNVSVKSLVTNKGYND